MPPPRNGLAGIVFIVLHDADSMIRKLMMGSRKLELRHVACHTFVTGHRAQSSTRFSATVARLALRIIVRGVAAHLVVRVMTSETANAWVVRVVTLAAR